MIPNVHQVMQQLPTVSIDKTDGCQVYLSKESVNCEIITAKSSEMNILIPDKSGEFVSEVHTNMASHEFIFWTILAKQLPCMGGDN